MWLILCFPLAFIPSWGVAVLGWLIVLLHLVFIPMWGGLLIGVTLLWNARLARPRVVQMLSILGGLALIAAPIGITALLINLWANC